MPWPFTEGFREYHSFTYMDTLLHEYAYTFTRVHVFKIGTDIKNLGLKTAKSKELGLRTVALKLRKQPKIPIKSGILDIISFILHQRSFLSIFDTCFEVF